MSHLRQRPRAAGERRRDMHIVDTTLFFAPHSGGVKRYLLTKHAHFAAVPGVRHSLCIPGARTAEVERGVFERCAPRIPFAGGYRVPLGLRRWRAALCELAPDVIEAGDPYHLAWMASDLAARLGIESVAFAHSDLATLIGSRAGAASRRVVERYLRTLYARFDLVTAPSRVIADRLAAIGVERLAVQPLGVDGAVFHPSRRDDTLRAELGLAPTTRLLVFAGRIAREKRIALVLGALARLGAPYHVLLVGGSERKRLAPTATVLPYEHDSARLARLLASADAFVHAGDLETFGMVAIEAMACGIPVVGVRAGALVELVDDSVGVLAQPRDDASLAEAIRALYERDLGALGAAARERVERRYTWASAFALQLERYRALAAAGGVAAQAVVA